MKNGKKLEFPEGREGVRGLESAKRIPMTGVPSKIMLFVICIQRVEFIHYLHLQY